jgi:protein TonB
MTASVLALVAVAAVTTSSGFAAPASEPVTKVKTEVIFEVGHPQTGAPEPATGLVPPGVVLLVESRGGSVMERYVKIHQELREAYRLMSFDKGIKAMLDIGVGSTKPVSSSIAGLDVTLKLLSVNDVQATYEVRLAESGEDPVVTRVAVRRSDWAIVGGRDGAKAPYFFLLFRPLTQAEEIDEARWEGMTKPKVLTSVNPKYPEEARKEKVQDIVVLELDIRADGTVASANVLEGKVPDLIEAAKEAALQWTFEPARDKAGRPVAVRYTVTLAFKLQ